jgi:hypothetical protein
MSIAQRIWFLLALVAALAATGRAQATEPARAAVLSRVPQTANRLEPDPGKVDEHRFWDSENKWLFTGVAASRTLDDFSTLNMRRRGRQEILLNNDVVDNHAAFATIEAAGVGVSIGASYLFHRYGHHRLERWTSILHISLTTTGAVRNYSLVTHHYRVGFASAIGAPR